VDFETPRWPGFCLIGVFLWRWSARQTEHLAATIYPFRRIEIVLLAFKSRKSEFAIPIESSFLHWRPICQLLQQFCACAAEQLPGLHIYAVK
jgi:hypothetical protein